MYSSFDFLAQYRNVCVSEFDFIYLPFYYIVML